MKKESVFGIISILISLIIILAFIFSISLSGRTFFGTLGYLLVYLLGPLLVGITGVMYSFPKGRKFKTWSLIILIIALALEIIAFFMLFWIKSNEPAGGLAYIALMPPHFLGTLLAIIAFVATIISKKK